MRLPRDKQARKRFGEKIRARRQRKGLTQEELASQLGITLYFCDHTLGKCDRDGRQSFSVPLMVKCVSKLEEGECNDVDQQLLSDILMVLELVPARAKTADSTKLTQGEVLSAIHALSSDPTPQPRLPLYEGRVMPSRPAMPVSTFCPMGFERSCSGCRVQWDCGGPI
jgi:transcriptional regulator with XRE-family HTH domain